MWFCWWDPGAFSSVVFSLFSLECTHFLSLTLQPATQQSKISWGSGNFPSQTWHFSFSLFSTLKQRHKTWSCFPHKTTLQFSSFSKTFFLSHLEILKLFLYCKRQIPKSCRKKTVTFFEQENKTNRLSDILVVHRLQLILSNLRFLLVSLKNSEFY